MQWVNDGFCDDMNNNDACDFDGRDCCGVHVNRQFCLECKCLSKSEVLYTYRKMYLYTNTNLVLSDSNSAC